MHVNHNFVVVYHCKYTKSLLRFNRTQTTEFQAEHIPSLQFGVVIICNWNQAHHSGILAIPAKRGASPSYFSVWNIMITYQNIKNLEDIKTEERNWEHESWITFLALSSVHFVVLDKPIGFWMTVCNIGQIFLVILTDFKWRITLLS